MKFVRHIASGGMGKVDEVVLEDGTVVARKTFQPSLMLGPTVNKSKMRERFIREAKVQRALALRAPHLFLAVLNADLEAETPWFTMPLASRSLDVQISVDRSQKRLNLDALNDVLDSLEFLHRSEYVHRDLKPKNVLLHEGRWKLSDFGLVLPLEEGEGAASLTTTDSHWGTALYEAPEQASGFHSVTKAADIYAFGCILHDFLYDRLHQRVPYAQRSCSGPMLPVLERCTHVQAERRFRTIVGLREALQRAAGAPLSDTVESVGSVETWLAELANVDHWSAHRVIELSAFLKGKRGGDVDRLFGALSPDTLSTLHWHNEDAWEGLAEGYCDWCRNAPVEDDGRGVAERLGTIWELGKLGTKASVIVALAVLGERTQSSLIQARLLEASLAMDDALAARVVVEVLAADATHQFLGCLQAQGASLDGLHPDLAAVLRH